MNIASQITKLIAPTLFKITGSDIFRLWRWLEQTETWEPRNRDQWRLQRLGDMIEHCWDNVPFYREFWSDHGVKIRRPRAFEELKAFPIIGRDIFRKNRESVQAANIGSIPHKNESTGGTTGAPLQYKQDLVEHSLRYAFAWHWWTSIGFQFGDNVCSMTGGSLQRGQATLRNRARRWLSRYHGVSCLSMNPTVAAATYDIIRRYQPTIIYGYPSMVAEFCEHVKQHDPVFRCLKGIVTTAEMLYPHYRQRIEGTLDAPVFNNYGCNDGGVISLECELHQGLHYNDLESVVEVESPDEAGVGLCAMTNLWNRSMPFVRYVNGDLLALGDLKCACGRIYPLIRSVEGRTGDVLRFPNGRTLGPPGLTLIFKEFPIDAWQVVQTGPAALEIRIKAKERLIVEKEAYIATVIRSHLNLDVDIRIRYTDQLATTSRGKLRPVFIAPHDEEQGGFNLPAEVSPAKEIVI
jgi:phenylacetate-CoA ligase